MLPIPAQKTITWLLVLALGHLPVPWAHTHEMLAGDLIALHVDQFHRNADPDVQLGWHVHLICFGFDFSLIDEGRQGDSSEYPLYYFDSSRDEDEETNLQHQCTGRSKTSGSRASNLTYTFRDPNIRSVCRLQALVLTSFQSDGTPLYYLNCSLLI